MNNVHGNISHAMRDNYNEYGVDEVRPTTEDFRWTSADSSTTERSRLPIVTHSFRLSSKWYGPSLIGGTSKNGPISNRSGQYGYWIWQQAGEPFRSYIAFN